MHSLAPLIYPILLKSWDGAFMALVGFNNIIKI